MLGIQVVVILLLGVLVAAMAGLTLRLVLGRERIASDEYKKHFYIYLVVLTVVMAFIGYNLFADQTQKIIAIALMVVATLVGALAFAGKERNMLVKMIYGVAGILVAAMVQMMVVGSHAPTALPMMHAKTSLSDKDSLQRGARAFRDYCFGCHGLSLVRYNQLEKIGISEELIKEYMLTTTTKPGDMMSIGMKSSDARAWFGVTPPDLSLMTSAKGTDYVYSYLNGFYKDETRPTGWNNVYFPNVGMPHVMWEEQGVKLPVMKDVAEHGTGKMVPTLVGLEQSTQGKRDEASYKQLTQDLTNFLFWASEPDRQSRHYIGIAVMLLLGVLAFLAYKLNKNYWKDIE